MINRRQAALATAAAATALGTVPALAQPVALKEGSNFRRLPQPLPSTPGKVEVVEFFWYGCPHCYLLEPYLEAWTKTLPKQVEFRPVHIFIREQSRPHQRLAHTLQVMGVEHRVRMPIFNAIHQQGNPLDTPERMLQLLTPLGVDGAKFMAAYNSFGVNSRVNGANQLANAYRVDGVPALGIGGQFVTSPAMAQEGQRVAEGEANRRALAIADQLIGRLIKA